MPGNSSTNINPGFVGRTRELERLRDRIGGRGFGPLIVVGPPGVGKTALAQEFIRRDTHGGKLLVSASAARSSGDLIQMIRKRLREYRNWKAVTVLIDDIEYLSGSPPDLAEFAAQAWERPLGGIQGKTRDDYFGELDWILLGRRVPPALQTVLSERRRLPLLEPIIQLRGLSQNELLEVLSRREGPEAPIISKKNAGLLAAIVASQFGGSPMVLASLAASKEPLEALLQALASQTNLSLILNRGKLDVIPSVQLPAASLVTPSGEAWSSVPHIFIPNVAMQWREQIDRFKRLINSPRLREAQLQTFFEENPHFLRGIEYSRIVAHPVLERTGDQGNLIPDFFLQPANGDFADILDLKLPNVPLIVGTKDRLRLSQAVMDSLAQMREYRDHFDDPENQKKLTERYGLHAYRPKAAIVIGTKNLAISLAKQRQIFEAHVPPFARVMTHDDLLTQMERLVETCAGGRNAAP